MLGVGSTTIAADSLVAEHMSSCIDKVCVDSLHRLADPPECCLDGQWLKHSSIYQLVSPVAAWPAHNLRHVGASLEALHQVPPVSEVVQHLTAQAGQG